MHTERRRDSLHSAQVLKSLRRQDVEADDVSPLIEIIYWSPFVEVRRDAAAAIASLSRNSTFCSCRLAGLAQSSHLRSLRCLHRSRKSRASTKSARSVQF